MIYDNVMIIFEREYEYISKTNSLDLWPQSDALITTPC